MTDAPGGGGDRLLSLDLWHTLVYLDPEAEEEYMRRQVRLATDVLESAPAAPNATDLGREAIARAFERVYAEAVVASQEGRSMGPVLQIQETGRRTGRKVDPAPYLERLAGLVERTPFQPAPGALGVLERLRRDGWATAVVSNTVGEPGTALRPILDGMGLSPLIDAWVFSDEHAWTKPAPEIFRLATDGLGIRPSRTVHVGDGWVDIEGARRANLRAGVLYTGLQHYGRRYRELFLPRGWSEPDARYRFRLWPELPGVLENALDGR